MKYKQVVKLIIDIAMYLIFVALMQEHLWDGLHEWLGIALFTLFIVHTILNFRWYQSLFKGKYTPTRTTSAVINIALFAAMLCCMVSSVLVSGKVFAFLNLGGARIGRTLHLVSTAWVFVLMSLHLGMHWNMLLTMARKHLQPSKIRTWPLRIPGYSFAIYGVATFVRRDVGLYLLLKSHFVFFDYSEPLIAFLLDYLAVMAMFVLIGCIISIPLKGLPAFNAHKVR